jgi:DNA-directed RNA polymerase beta subunit
MRAVIIEIDGLPPTFSFEAENEEDRATLKRCYEYEESGEPIIWRGTTGEKYEIERVSFGVAYNK